MTGPADDDPSGILACARAGAALGRPIGLERRAMDARAFYATIAAATLLGAGIVVAPIDPMRALVFAAVVNGAVAGPVIVAMVALGSIPSVTGRFVLARWLRVPGWGTALPMGGVTVGMLVV